MTGARRRGRAERGPIRRMAARRRRRSSRTDSMAASTSRRRPRRCLSSDGGPYRRAGATIDRRAGHERRLDHPGRGLLEPRRRREPAQASPCSRSARTLRSSSPTSGGPRISRAVRCGTASGPSATVRRMLALPSCEILEVARSGGEGSARAARRRCRPRCRRRTAPDRCRPRIPRRVVMTACPESDVRRG